MSGWDQEGFAVYSTDRTTGHRSDGSTVRLTFDHSRHTCNLWQPDGSVCRRLPGHAGLHIGVSGDLIVQSGIVILADSKDPATVRNLPRLVRPKGAPRTAG